MSCRAHAGRAAVLVAAAVLATGCSGDDDAQPPTPSDVSDSTDTATTTAPPDDRDASGDLSDFVCEPDDAGGWDASGVLTPSAAAPEDYAVTVLVTGPDETSAPGRRTVLRALEPGVPTPFEVPDVRPVGAGDLTCQVRVVTLGG